LQAVVVNGSTGAVVVAATTASTFKLPVTAGSSYLVEQPSNPTTSMTYARVTVARPAPVRPSAARCRSACPRPTRPSGSHRTASGRASSHGRSSRRGANSRTAPRCPSPDQRVPATLRLMPVHSPRQSAWRPSFATAP
jgi:hypothetical protein